jgi:hypothetical protein
LFNHLQAKGSEPSCPDRSLCEHGLITISSQHLTENEKENNDAQLLLARRQAYNRLIPTAESHAFGQFRVADDPPRSALWQFNGLGVSRVNLSAQWPTSRCPFIRQIPERRVLARW